MTTEKVDDLTAAQTRSQNHLDQLTIKVDDLTAAQTRSQNQLDQLTEKVDRVSGRVDEFVFQAQRLFTQQAERLNAQRGKLTDWKQLYSY